MMPGWTLQSPRNETRAAAIAAALLDLDYDILCFEKAFDGGSREVIGKAFTERYPYRWGPANPSSGLKISSGVWVVSRFPLWGYQEIQFKDNAGIESFSRKGAMLLSGKFGSEKLRWQEFQIVATHLQGDDGPAYRPDHQRIRGRQMAQIRDELLAPHHRPGVPLFLCGDLCTPRLDPKDQRSEGKDYRNMLATFGAENGPEYRVTLDDARSRNDMAVDNTGRTDELDYILVRKNGCGLDVAWSRRIIQRRGWDRRHNDLSYRYAVGATIELR